MADLARLVIEVKINGAKNAVKGLEDIEKASERADKKNKELGDGFDKGKRALNQFSSGLKIVGRDLTRYLTVPLTGASIAASKFSLDLNSGLANTQSLLAGTFAQNTVRINEFKDAVLEAGANTGKGFKDMTEGLYQVVSAFQDNEDTIGRFNTVLNASIAGLSTAKEALDLLSAVTKAYGDTSTQSVEKVSDLAFEAVRLGQTTFPELASAMQVATDRTSRLGVSQEELFAVFATLTGVTGDASMVATQLRSALDSLLNPTEELSSLFSTLGVDSAETLIAERGLAEAFILINKAAKDTDTPLQKFITRKEGITAVSRLANEQLEDFIFKLEEIQNATGATDRALLAQTQGVNKVGFELKQTKQGFINLASEIGDTFLPTLSELLKVILNISTGIKDIFSPEVITLTGLFLAIAGPLLLLIGSIIRLSSLISSASVFLAGFGISLGAIIGPAIAVAAAITIVIGIMGHLNKLEAERQQRILETASSNEELFSSYKSLSKETEVNSTQVKKLLEDYPRLSEYIDDTVTSAKELQQALLQLSEVEAREALGDQIKDYESTYKNIKRLTEQQRIYNNLTVAERKIQGVTDPTNELDKARQKWDELLAQLKKDGETLGFDIVRGLGGNLTFIAKVISDTLEDGIKKTGEAGEDVNASFDDIGDRLKTWQEYFADITGTPLERFARYTKDAKGNITGVVTELDQGKKAVEEFNKITDKTVSQMKEIAVLTGQDIKFSEFYDEQIEGARRTIESLLALKEEQIANKESFELTDQSIQGLIMRINELRGLSLDAQANEFYKAFQAIEDYAKAHPELITNEEKLKQQQDLVSDALEVFGATAEGRALPIYAALISMSKRYKEVLGDTNKEFKTWQDRLEEGIRKLEALKDASPEITQAFVDIGLALADWGVEFATESFNQLGRAMVGATDDGYGFTSMLADQAKTLAEMIPKLMIQAGLNLLSAGDPLGWALLGGGILTGIVGGIAQQTIDNRLKELETTPNAKGNVFSSSGIVNTPTLFPFAKGTGLMGEAGPEAIMPLTRTSSGELGVRAEGGSSAVTVIINNNSNANVSTQERTTPNGKELYVTVGNIVKAQMGNGEFDKTMRTRYGMRSTGVRV